MTVSSHTAVMYYATNCGARAVGVTIRRRVPSNRFKRLFPTSEAFISGENGCPDVPHVVRTVS